VVKIVTRTPPELHRAKAVVRAVAGDAAELELLTGSAEHFSLPASSLETVLPRLGGRVAVVAGAYVGSRGELRALQEELFSCIVALPDGRTVTLPYESVCKMHEE